MTSWTGGFSIADVEETARGSPAGAELSGSSRSWREAARDTRFVPLLAPRLERLTAVEDTAGGILRLATRATAGGFAGVDVRDAVGGGATGTAAAGPASSGKSKSDSAVDASPSCSSAPDSFSAASAAAACSPSSRSRRDRLADDALSYG